MLRLIPKRLSSKKVYSLCFSSRSFSSRIASLFAFMVVGTSVLLPLHYVQCEEAEVAPPTPAFQAGDVFPAYTVEDQFHKEHTLAPDTRLVIMSANMDLTKEINSYLTKQGKEFLAQNHAEYVSDISEMPGIITWLFARPKMQKYNFRILLANDDDFSKRYGLTEDNITVFQLNDEQKVLSVQYLSTARGIPLLFQSNEGSAIQGLMAGQKESAE